MRIAVAADHNGIELKARLLLWLGERGHETFDAGAHEPGVVVDYPPLCAAVSRRVAREEAELAIVIGGSGQGEVIACNKIRGVRAGLAYSHFAVEISRGNNDANVMVLGTKVLGDDQALALVELWLGTPFKGRQHADRLAMISELEITELDSAPES
jgi:ribose 5-phosphate isomerase B